MMSASKAKILKELVQHGETAFLPHVSVDNVIFGYDQRQIKVLLLQVTDTLWMLPGGYVLRHESLDEAAKRNLEERIGLPEVYLRQFHAFGRPERSFSQEIKVLFQQLGAMIPKDSWIFQRFVSIGYYALVHMENCTPITGLFAKSHAWFDITALPTLLFDHQKILCNAHNALKKEAEDFPVLFHLLQKEFTMPELHAVFETLYGKKIDRSRFQKKMFSYGVFERLDVLDKTVPHRKPFLYRFKK